MTLAPRRKLPASTENELAVQRAYKRLQDRLNDILPNDVLGDYRDPVTRALMTLVDEIRYAERLRVIKQIRRMR